MGVKGLEGMAETNTTGCLMLFTLQQTLTAIIVSWVMRWKDIQHAMEAQKQIQNFKPENLEKIHPLRGLGGYGKNGF